MKDELDFEIVDYLQGLSAWAAMGVPGGADVDAIMQMAAQYNAAVMVPICGKAVQMLGTVGVQPDGWMSKKASFRFKTLANISHIIISAWLPPQHAGTLEVTVGCGGAESSSLYEPGTLFVIDFPLELAAATEDVVRVELSSVFQPSALPGGSNDSRLLGCIFASINFQ